jgi:hypothetical protein
MRWRRIDLKPGREVMGLRLFFKTHTPDPRCLALAALMTLIAQTTLAADPAGALQGEYRFHGKTLVDPPPSEARDSHLGLLLEGPVARDLFKRMKSRAVRDICLDDGSRTKTQGPLRCTELAGGKAWQCEFAIQLDTLKLVADGAC